MSEKIENLLEENRKFSPSESLTKNANATSGWYQEANENRLEFWKKQAFSAKSFPKNKFSQALGFYSIDSRAFLFLLALLGPIFMNFVPWKQASVLMN